MKPSSVLVLSEADTAQLVSARDAIDALKAMLTSSASGKVVNLPRRRASIPGFTLHSLSAVDSQLGRAALKQYSTTREGARFHVGLYDASSGELVSLMQADRLGQLRTGAISAIAAQQLLPQTQTGKLALIGCGWQARSQLECLTELISFTSISVFCRNEESRLQFSRQMSQQLGLDVVPADSAEGCVRGARTLVTITSAREPVVDERWLDECQLVVAAGSNQPRNAELPAELVLRAKRIVVDDIEGCRNEAGDLIQAAAQLTRPDALWERLESLASLFSSPDAAPHALQEKHDAGSNQHASDASRPEEPYPILFKSVGMAASDLALASLIYDRARAAGAGSTLQL